MASVIIRLGLLISGICAGLILLAVLLRLPSPVIVYVGDVNARHRLYQIDLRTEITRLLTQRGTRNITPVWSPDGESIAFASNRDGGFGIYLMDADGDNVRPLVNPAQGDALSPVWSPSGEQLTYISNNRGGPFFIDIYDLGEQTSQRAIVSSWFAANPHWMPDEDSILFVTNHNTQTLLARQKLEPGANAETLTSALGPHNILFISVHPDGQQVALSIEHDDQASLYLLDLPNLTLRQLTDTPGYDEWVQWSPDGTRLVFTRTPVIGGGDIYTLTLATGEIQAMTAGDGFYVAPSWSPDGESIAFVGLRDNRWSLWLVDPDSGTITRTATANVVASRPQWHPR
jgi:Tol biopolymer transport system component